MKKILSLITLLFLSFVSLSQTITTVAGNWTNPNSILFDSHGSLIVSSFNKIFKVDTNGNHSDIAGSVDTGYSGNNGLAVNAKIRSTDISIDKYDNIFILDLIGGNIRKIKNDTIKLFLSSQSVYSTTDISIDSNSNLYVSTTGGESFKVLKVDSLGNNQVTFANNTGFKYPLVVPGQAMQCSFQPVGMAIDKNSKYMYIADYFNKRILRIDIVSGDIINFAGLGVSPAGQPQIPAPGEFEGDGILATDAKFKFIFSTTVGMTFDSFGNLYISDNNRIRKIDINTNMITTVVGMDSSGYVDGPLVSAKLNNPTSIAFDKDDNLYIVDQNLTPSGSVIRKIMFNGPNSIRDTKIDKTISVYPNPFQDILVLKSDLEINSIQIVNTLGQNVISQKGNRSNSVTLDTKTLKSGLYFININNNISKIIKQ